jgi:recombination protein U
VAVIDKRPTPVKVMDVVNGKVSGFFERKSTVDYDGTYKARSLYFEAKSTEKDKFPLSNVSEHQVDHLVAQHNVGAVCFLLVEFSKRNIVFLVPLPSFLYYWNRRSDKAHIPLEDFQQYAFKVEDTKRTLCDYLLNVDQYITYLKK